MQFYLYISIFSTNAVSIFFAFEPVSWCKKNLAFKNISIIRLSHLIISVVKFGYNHKAPKNRPNVKLLPWLMRELYFTQSLYYFFTYHHILP